MYFSCDDAGHILMYISQTTPDKCQYDAVLSSSEVSSSRAATRVANGSSLKTQEGKAARKSRRSGGGLEGWIYNLMNYDHSLFWRTRRAISAGGFFTTIHNMTDVAAARAYLGPGLIRLALGLGYRA